VRTVTKKKNVGAVKPHICNRNIRDFLDIQHMEVQHIITRRTARVYTDGVLSEKTKAIWLIAHGYGMLAQFFIKKFECLDPEEHYLVVPEALSRAYLEGFSGKVGAIWMTSEDRESEISDYIHYLNLVYEQFIAPNRKSGVPVIAFGFSQGSSTICRWANANPYKFDRLMLWGGAVPEDVLSNLQFASHPVDICVGNNDPFIPKEQIEEYLRRSKSMLPEARFHVFEGGHEVEASLLMTLINQGY
jgi:predicted esterase